MINAYSKISNSKKSLLLITIILLMAILFETSQQLYYIRRFNLGSDATFFGLLKTQTFRWIVWVVLSVFLIWFSNTESNRKHVSLRSYINYGLVILGLVFLNILIISITDIMTTNSEFTVLNLFTEFMPFFMFQKAPIYILGYISIAIILHLYFANEQLQIKVEELSELKKTNHELYKKLSKNIEDKAPILNIKIGNKRKIIPVENIRWIEADDYCVKVHTVNSGSYTMRSSLKSLEEKLSTNFLRVHRKAIVNMTMAKELHLKHAPNLILNNNIEVPVSKSNLKTVKDFLN